MSAEIEIADGRRLLGVVRELPGGLFAAIIDEQVVGHYDSRKAATDAVIQLARPGAA